MVARARPEHGSAASSPASRPQAGHALGADHALEDADHMAVMFWRLEHPEFQ
jgi:hypothetical protein